MIRMGAQAWFWLAAMMAAAHAQPAVVEVRPFSELAIAREHRAPGVVLSRNRATLAAEITAPVAAVLVDVGDTVADGTVVVELDAADYRLALAGAEARRDAIDARIAQAQLRLERAETLSEKDYVSADDLLARQTDLAVLRADRAAQDVAVSEAQRQVEKATVRAPFAGAVVERSAQLGAFVSVGTPLLTLVELDGREVEAEVVPAAAASLADGADIHLVSDIGRWALAVARISPVTEAATRTIPVRFRFVGAPAPIGTSGTVEWTDQGTLLPPDLLVRRDGQLGYFTVSEGKADFVPLPQAQEGRPARLEQLPPGGVVTRGRNRLQHGDPVEASQQ